MMQEKVYNKAVSLIKGEEPEGKCEWCKVVSE